MRDLFLVTFITVLTALVPGCSPSESDIKQEIESARACQADTDCVDVGTACPFGCSIVVNKSDADHIRDLLDGYTSTCAYDCAQPTSTVCEKNLCTNKF